MSPGSVASAKNMSENTEEQNKVKDNLVFNDKINTFSEQREIKSVENKDIDTVIKVKSAIPRRRQDLLKWYGWGYQDSTFKISDGVAIFTGNRYLLGGKKLPHALQWIKEYFNVDITKVMVPPPQPTSFQESKLPLNIKEELEKIAPLSTDGMDRLIRAHGQTLKDVYCLRKNNFQKIPDAVIWPETHQQVEDIVKCASKHQFVIIPFGGGTSVSGSVTCPANEERPILLLDTTAMNAILWLDKEQLLARVQAGILGQDLERELRSRGFTVGHEPDSFEFSTLGGWVATRASGMKKNTYGNIEDLVVQTKIVTPKGVIERNCRVPRISCGPDWEHVVLGSEGCLGVVTEVTLKIRPLPPCVRYGSLVFPDWEAGFHFEREVARQRAQPSSIRLMDNEQFRMGHALKVEQSWGGVVLDGLKKFYITRIKGFDPLKMCVVTLLMEGSSEHVARSEKRLNAIAAEYGGVPGGARNGEIGYTLTFVIAYIRDLALDYDIVAESFETSVSWERTLALCRNTKERVRRECRDRNIKEHIISCRLTQTYDAGCCIYFYFAFKTDLSADSVRVYEDIEEAARDEIIANGGSISHHHGVGKLRKKWYTQTVSEPGRRLLLATKQALDPDNIFALGNMAYDQYKADGLGLRSKL
ncbi:alkyldihydroxyacetonephosphate synthase [Danaus plexippus]|uniref:alkyldihydroxyacetonephosphate synthase n=1 Tax=Danaus plexippus TaxID=13037 RepID=UPI002AB30EF1|nr:alkyldihydroxyacetonephosphate synthase [Danaus plexippus]